MLAHQIQKSLSNAREYFREHLQAGDYYSAGQRITGKWFGGGAERLGLTGDAGEKEFLRLCENQDPQTGERLTVRMKKSVRRIFEDFADRRNGRCEGSIVQQSRQSAKVESQMASDGWLEAEG